MPPTPVFLTEHIRAIEDRALALPDPPPLMQRAGTATAQLVQRLAGERTRKILVLAGPGNNGGDALVAATHLKKAWFDVRVVFTGSPEKLKTDAKAALDTWKTCGGELTPEIPGDFAWDLALDGLFGIGLERELDSRHAQLVAAVNAASSPVVAIDIPSGLHANTGCMLGVAVRAAHTITFLGLKAGLLTRDGPDHSGEVVLDTLGVQGGPLPAGHGYLIDREVVATVLPPRPRNSHKGTFGDVAIIGGAPGMVGAALLAGRAALKMGAGRVLVGTLADGPAVDPVQPDLMLRSVQELLSRASLSCVVVGPGLANSDSARHALERALKLDTPLVLDADALNLAAESDALRKAISRRRSPTVITPHPAEAGRLLRIPASQVQDDRIAAARMLAEQFQSPTVVKGAGSICALPDGKWFINTSGNPGMASAGMGDVLAGILGALLGQGASPDLALLAGVHLHGLAADDLVSRGFGPVGLTASETIDAARAVFNRIQRG